MVKKAPVSKAAQANKIQKTSSKEKKKWTKGKQKDTVKRGVSIDPTLLARIQKENTNSVCVTKTNIAEKYNLNAGVAQKVLNHFVEQGLLKLVSACSLVKVYSKNVKVEKVDEVKEEVKGEVAAGGWN